MQDFKAETQETLKRFSEDRISRAECIDALDCALLALIPHLDPADLPAVQAILIENSRSLADIDGKRESSAIASMDRAGSVPLCR